MSVKPLPDMRNNLSVIAKRVISPADKLGTKAAHKYIDYISFKWFLSPTEVEFLKDIASEGNDERK